MASNSLENLDEFFSDVEKTNGIPVIVTMYGLRKIDIAGKKYLTPMSIDECAKVMADAEGVSEDETLEKLSKRSWEGRDTWCYGEGVNCKPLNGCKGCWGVYSGGFYCKCVDD